jgi:hypothetical protein
MGRPGGVPEWPKGTGCKPVGSAYGGSNPPAPTPASPHVPRWAGDANSMPVLADVKVLPEHLAETRCRLVDAWSA